MFQKIERYEHHLSTAAPVVRESNALSNRQAMVDVVRVYLVCTPVMTYEQVAQRLTELGQHAGVGSFIVRGENTDTTALHVIPVAWFIAMKSLGLLYVGTYEGPEHRIVATKNFTFEQLTPTLLKEEVTDALADQVGHLLDPQDLKKILSKLPVSRNRFEKSEPSRNPVGMI